MLGMEDLAKVARRTFAAMGAVVDASRLPVVKSTGVDGGTRSGLCGFGRPRESAGRLTLGV